MKSTNHLVGVTICTTSYLSFARTLAKSFLKYHPDAAFIVLFLNPIGVSFDPRKEVFHSLEIGDLGNISDLPGFLFKYDTIGLNTAVKPYFLEYLFDKFPGIEKLLYFDTDIQIFSRLRHAIGALDSFDIVLTPHITTPLADDGKSPSEMSFLLSGSYNLGFLGLRRSRVSKRLLSWWQEKTYDGAVNRVELGLFRDQKPVDLVPSVFDGVYLLKDPGYNVAYWNLHERKRFTGHRGAIVVNGKRLVFFHFSGFSPDNPEAISKYQNRFTFADFSKVFRDLFASYAGTLRLNGYDDSINWPNPYKEFDNGQPIADDTRRTYWELGGRRRLFGDPFTTGPDSFYQTYVKDHDLSSPRVSGEASENKWYWLIKTSAPVSGLIASLKLVLGNHYEGLSVRFMEKFLPRYTSLAPVSRTESFVEVAGQFGLTVIGNFERSSGVAESARSFARLAERTEIPISTIELENTDGQRETESKLLYPVRLFAVNADSISQALSGFKAGDLKRGYNIASFHWELEEFPIKFLPSFAGLAEVWAPSDFCARAISRISPVPVVKMNWVPGLPAGLSGNRKKFGLSDREYVFLFNYDGGHFPERKNPLGLIKAFTQAGLPADRAKLVLKTMHNKDDSYTRAVKKKISGYKNIILVDEDMSRREVLELVSSCDCYVSLHRSEGFGATMFEAMALGKPVIATGYSGNLEFMTARNSLLVSYRMTKIPKDIGPYSRGSFWAEPDYSQASKLVRQVYRFPDRAGQLGRRGQQDIRKRFNEEKLADQIRRRLEIIGRFVSNGQLTQDQAVMPIKSGRTP